MKLETTASPAADDEAFVIAQVRAYNAGFMPQDSARLCVFARADDGSIVGGLTGGTAWNYLHIAFLWVDQARRGSGLASALMAAAEAEALTRGCGHAAVDTFSFQALEFYRKRGYEEVGALQGYSGGRQRHYLHKLLAG